MEIIQLYKSILSSLDLVTDDQGLISMQLGDELHPTQCRGKRLVLPTPDRLRSGNFDGLMAFHPISESVSRGESPVIKKTRQLINFRLSTIISCLMMELIELAADSAKHERMTPTQSKYLTLVTKANQKTVSEFEKIFSASRSDNNRLASIYLKRGGTLKEGGKAVKYSRLATVSFPITEDFGTKEHVIMGTKVSAQTHKMFESLFYYILPDADKIETYSFGSNVMTAPYFHSLMHAFANVAEVLNKTVQKFRKFLDAPETLMVNLDWLEHIDDLTPYRKMIPMLDGNEGPHGVDEEEEQAGEQQTGRRRGVSVADQAKQILNDPGEQPTPPPTNARTPQPHLQAPMHQQPQVAVQPPQQFQQPQPQVHQHHQQQPQQPQGVLDRGGAPKRRVVSWDEVAQHNQPAAMMHQQHYPPGQYPQQPAFGYQQQQLPANHIANHPRNRVNQGFQSYPPQQQPQQGYGPGRASTIYGRI